MKLVYMLEKRTGVRPYHNERPAIVYPDSLTKLETTTATVTTVNTTLRSAR